MQGGPGSIPGHRTRSRMVQPRVCMPQLKVLHATAKAWQNQNLKKELKKNGAYYTEWSKSQRGKQILHTNTYIRNLERWYWWNDLQGSNRDAAMENRLMDRVWDVWREEYGSIHHRLWNRQPMGICWVTQELKPGLCDNLEGWEGEGGGRGFQVGGDMGTPMADSCGWTAGTNTTP